MPVRMTETAISDVASGTRRDLAVRAVVLLRPGGDHRALPRSAMQRG